MDGGLTGRHLLQYLDTFGVLTLQGVVDGLHLLDVRHCSLGTTGGRRKQEVNGGTGSKWRKEEVNGETGSKSEKQDMETMKETECEYTLKVWGFSLPESLG